MTPTRLEPVFSPDRRQLHGGHEIELELGGDLVGCEQSLGEVPLQKPARVADEGVEPNDTGR